MIERTEVITAWALFDRDPVPQWSFGRVTLLGDAAHPLLPFGSQGASQAVLDCEALVASFADALKQGKVDGISGSPSTGSCPPLVSLAGVDVIGALKAYDKKRVGPASAVVVANRDMGPTRVLRVVAEATCILGTRSHGLRSVDAHVYVHVACSWCMCMLHGHVAWAYCCIMGMRGGLDSTTMNRVGCLALVVARCSPRTL